MPESTTQVFLEWQSLDHYPHERGRNWYALGSIFIVGMTAYALFNGSWTTALLALLIGGMYFFLRNVPPRSIVIQIDGLGIRVDGIHYTWNTLQNFWILTNQNRFELHIARRGQYVLELRVFIVGIDAGLVRKTLLTFLPEREGMEERFLDLLSRILKL